MPESAQDRKRRCSTAGSPVRRSRSKRRRRSRRRRSIKSHWGSYEGSCVHDFGQGAEGSRYHVRRRDTEVSSIVEIGCGGEITATYELGGHSGDSATSFPRLRSGRSFTHPLVAEEASMEVEPTSAFVALPPGCHEPHYPVTKSSIHDCGNIGYPIADIVIGNSTSGGLWDSSVRSSQSSTGTLVAWTPSPIMERQRGRRVEHVDNIRYCSGELLSPPPASSVVAITCSMMPDRHGHGFIVHASLEVVRRNILYCNGKWCRRLHHLCYVNLCTLPEFHIHPKAERLDSNSYFTNRTCNIDKIGEVSRACK